MAGITANSVTVTMGSTAVDNTQAGYLNAEQITLATSPTATSYVWSVAKPSGSNASAALSTTTGASPLFTPDVAGLYLFTCTVDATTEYILRISVTELTTTTVAQAHRLQPVTDASVPAPALGEALFFSNDASRWRVKDSSANVRDFDPGARTGQFTLASGTATISDTSVTAETIVVPNCITASNRGTLTYSRVVGTSITVTSSDGADASVYDYALIG